MRTLASLLFSTRRAKKRYGSWTPKRAPSSAVVVKRLWQTRPSSAVAKMESTSLGIGAGPLASQPNSLGSVVSQKRDSGERPSELEENVLGLGVGVQG